MQVFNVVLVALLSAAQHAGQVAAAAAFTHQSNFKLAGKPALAAIQQSHAMDTTVATRQRRAAQDMAQERRSGTPYDTTHHMDTRGMTPWTYGTEMWPSWRDSDAIREPGEHGPNHEAKHDRSLGRRGPRAWPYMDEIISHLPDKSWVILGFLTGLFACLPCICSSQAEDRQQGFDNGMLGLSAVGLLIVIWIVLTKLGWIEVFWRIHLLTWGYHWWFGLLFVPCIPCICCGALALSYQFLFRIIFPPLSKDGGYGKDADDIAEKALGDRMKHFEQRHPEASWSDLMPYGADFLHHEPQPGPRGDEVPHLTLVPREPGDWKQYASINGSLSGT